MINLKDELELLPVRVITSFKTKDALNEITQFIVKERLDIRYDFKDLSRAVDILNAYFIGKLEEIKNEKL